jgi:hypothetical protein
MKDVSAKRKKHALSFSVVMALKAVEVFSGVAIGLSVELSLCKI